MTQAIDTTPAGNPAAGTPAATGPGPAYGPLDDALAYRLRSRITLLAADRPTFEVTAPWTGELLARLPHATDEDVREAVRKARAGQPAWAALSFARRRQIFLKVHDLVLARQSEITDLIQLETGKARRHAFEEVADVAMVARYYAHSAEKHLQPVRRHGALPLLTHTVEHHQPKGVIGVISPWNYPLSMSITDLIPALLAGNAVVLRPDTQTPLTALWGVDLLLEAGVPEDVLLAVTGEGRILGPPLIEAVDYVMFTGSTSTGRNIAQACAARLIGCSLELGGKNAMLVLADADIDAAVDGAIRGCFPNAGQLCISIERLYVEAPVVEEFSRKLAAKAAALKVGQGFGFDVDMGSLISQQQLETVSRHVDDAIAKGATVLAGGKARPDLGPYFFEPTVLTDVTDDMELGCAETFGPVVAIYPISDADEGVRRANESEYGLNASIWTRDTERGARLGTQIRTGTVNVNEVYAAAYASVDAPMGGMKNSGLGRRHGREGILKYTESQTVAVQRVAPVAPPPWMSQERYSKMMVLALKAFRYSRIIP